MTVDKPMLGTLYHYRAKITRVVDGDTFDADIDLGFSITTRLRLRLKGIDTPELYRPSNEAERAHALAAKEFVDKTIGTGDVIVRTYSDKSRLDRWEADVFVAAQYYANLAGLLELNGFAKRASY